MGEPDLSTIYGFFNTWENSITAIVAIVAISATIFVTAWTVWNDKKNLKLNGLSLAFQKLNNPEERESRKKILSAYYDYHVNNNLIPEYTSTNFEKDHPRIDLLEYYPDLKEDVDRVKSNFDEIAVMAKNGLVNKKAYFDAYHGSMLRCYGALHGNIKKSRQRTGSYRQYNSAFLDQCVDVLRYWKKKYSDDDIIYHGQERNDFVLQRFEENDSWRIRILHPKSPLSKCLVYCNDTLLISSKHNDVLEHTIEESGGDNYITSQKPNEDDKIKIKSDGKIVKLTKFSNLELTK